MTGEIPRREAFASLISLLGRQWRRAVDRRLQPLGLTEATWLPLIHLSRAPSPPRQKDLAATLVLDGSSVVRLLDALAGAGPDRTPGGKRRPACQGDQPDRAWTGDRRPRGGNGA